MSQTSTGEKARGQCKESAATHRLDRGGRLGDVLILTMVVQHHVRSVAGERQCDATAHAFPASSRDQRYAPLKFHVQSIGGNGRESLQSLVNESGQPVRPCHQIDRERRR